ncbi:MAG: response regulator [Planctomycetes bacterium]|nr:response regulator [Planctomycetota bacterium]
MRALQKESEVLLIRVLACDDDDDVRAVVELALAASGRFDVQPVASGEAALAACAEGRPDLVLLDVLMPGMDGMQTLAALRASEVGVHIPVIFLSGKSSADDVRMLMEQGAAGVLEKPFDLLSLADRVLAIYSEAAGVASAPRGGT